MIRTTDRYITDFYAASTLPSSCTRWHHGEPVNIEGKALKDNIGKAQGDTVRKRKDSKQKAHGDIIR